MMPLKLFLNWEASSTPTSSDSQLIKFRTALQYRVAPKNGPSRHSSTFLKDCLARLPFASRKQGKVGGRALPWLTAIAKWRAAFQRGTLVVPPHSQKSLGISTVSLNSPETLKTPKTPGFYFSTLRNASLLYRTTPLLPRRSTRVTSLPRQHITTVERACLMKPSMLSTIIRWMPRWLRASNMRPSLSIPDAVTCNPCSTLSMTLFLRC